MKFYHLWILGIPDHSSADEYDMLDDLSDFLKNKGLKNGEIFYYRDSGATNGKITLRFFYNQDRDQAAKALNLSNFLGHTITAFIVDPEMDDLLDFEFGDKSF
jgi:hypothetical protein